MGSIDTREDILWHFEPVPIEKLVEICDAIHIRSRPTSDAIGSQIDAKKFLLESVIAKYEKRISQVERINSLPLYPDEVNRMKIDYLTHIVYLHYMFG